MLNHVTILAIAHSSNSKTGDIAQTYTSPNSCPNSCVFKKSGACYAKANFHCAMQWKRTEKEEGKNLVSPSSLRKWVEENTGRGAMIRHNVAGDIAYMGTDKISARLLSVLIEAYRGRRAYTYTHCKPSGRNLSLVRASCSRGFTVNFSCESINVADAVMAAGAPAVLAVPEILPKDFKSPAGRRVVMCPAQTHESVTCKSCGLCARAGRSVIVAFAAHGSKKRIAIEQLKEAAAA